MAHKNMKINPWERQPKESPQAYEAFVIYRNMGAERSIQKVSQMLSKSVTLIKRWSREKNWVERSRAWDNEQDRVTREALQRGVVNMHKKHVTMAEALFIKAAKALKNIEVEEMDMLDIVKAVDLAVKIERLSRGEATERTDGKSKISFGDEHQDVIIYIPDNGRDKS